MTTNSSSKNEDPRVITNTEIEGISLKNSLHRMTMVEVMYKSVKEARNRAIVLALATANITCSSQTFFRFCTKRDFSEPY